jgi:hypothetical protein
MDITRPLKAAGVEQKGFPRNYMTLLMPDGSQATWRFYAKRSSLDKTLK